MVLLIDNYDSFTFNLLDYAAALGADVKVVRNDELTADEMFALKPGAVIISPGPSNPQHAGVCVEFIRKYAGKVPMFGVCLGMQSMGYAFGGDIVSAKRIMHGKISKIRHTGKGVFEGMPENLSMVRYHSLAVSADTMPECLEITAAAEDGEVMGLRHKKFDIEGVQFHPESVLSYGGKRLIENFLRLSGEIK